MQKKFIKLTTIIAPITSVPLIAASCGQNNSNQNYNYYLNQFKTALNQQLVAIKTKIIETANQNHSSNHQIDISKSVTQAITNAKQAAAKDRNKPSNYNSNNFDKITITGQSNNYQITYSNKKYILTAYPSSILVDNLKTTLNYTISLNKQTLKGDITIDNSKNGYAFYNNLFDSTYDYTSSAINSDKSIIAVGAEEGLGSGNAAKSTLSIGIKAANSQYNFTNYDTITDNIHSLTFINNTTLAICGDNYLTWGKYNATTKKFTFTKINISGTSSQTIAADKIITTNDDTAYVGTYDGIYKLTNLNNSTPTLDRTPVVASVYATSLTSDGTNFYFISGSDNYVTVAIYDAAQKNYQLWKPQLPKSGEEIAQITYHSNQLFLATDQGLETAKFNLANKTLTSEIYNANITSDADKDMLSLTVSQDASKVYLGTLNGKITTASKTTTGYDLKQSASIHDNGYGNNITSVALSKNSNDLYITVAAVPGSLGPASPGVFAITKINWFE